MEAILELVVAAIFTNWEKVKRVFSKKRETDTTFNEH
jgi:hypothetical protein